MIRRALFVGLLLGPLTIVLHYATDLGATAEFVLAAAVAHPARLADRRGHRARRRAHRARASAASSTRRSGTRPELIIALIAVNDGLTEVVRGSLTGSVVGNLLLVLGFSLLAGPRGELDRVSSFLSFGAIAVAILLFLIPAIPSWHGDPNRHEIVVLSVPVSLALLVVYVVVTLYSLRRHRGLHVAERRRDRRPGRSGRRSSCSPRRRS